jgi:hypothetical protein
MAMTKQNAKAQQAWKELGKKARQHTLEFAVRYCGLHPPRKPLPKGRVLVHNHIAHTKDMPLGLNGFRVWTQKADPMSLELCRCGWQGVTHYHFKGESHKSFTPAQLEKRLDVEPGWYAEALT